MCEPLNADFDGDTVSVVLVPESVKDDVFNRMSPKTSKIYKKNLGNIFSFNHEALNGLAVLSEWKADNMEELHDPRYFYTDYAQLLKDAEVDHKLQYGTPIVYTGKIGSVDYKSKITTYGRIRISKILDADMDEIYINTKEKVFADPYQRINAKTAARLMTFLYGQDEEGIEKARQLRQLAYKAVTKAGVVTFDYQTLYVDTNNETYAEMRKIADSGELTDKQKMILLTDLYGKYEKEVEREFSDDLKKELDMAGRVKIASLCAINMPQYIIASQKEEPKILNSNLLEGLDEKEYQLHAIENRSLGAIKQSGVN